MTVRAALEREIGGMNEQVRGSALAALALAMADAMDAKPAAIMGAELAAIIKQLNELSPPPPVRDELDELRQRAAENGGVTGRSRRGRAGRTASA